MVVVIETAKSRTSSITRESLEPAMTALLSMNATKRPFERRESCILNR